MGSASGELSAVSQGVPLRGTLIVDLGRSSARPIHRTYGDYGAAGRPRGGCLPDCGRPSSGRPDLVPATVMEPRFGVVVLTQGKRPDDLHRALESLLAQRGVQIDAVVVGNGWQPTDLPQGVRALALPENLGIPAGRNAGVPLVTGELLFFLDDDARLPEADVLHRMASRFAADPELGLLQPRVVDPDGRPAPRRWTPRVRVGDPVRSSPAMSIWEGAVAIRRDAFDRTGGWPEPFWYAHEGIELAWRVWDCGYQVRYDGAIEAHHPAIQPTRHAEFYRFQARNRIWLARRNLPLPVGMIYDMVWIVIGGLRLRSKMAVVETVHGYWLGLSRYGGQRRPMSWRTVWQMTRARPRHLTMRAATQKRAESHSGNHEPGGQRHDGDQLCQAGDLEHGDQVAAAATADHDTHRGNDQQ